MKLYVWNNPYGVRYGGSCLYVMAESEEQAREVATEAQVSQFGYAPTQVRRLDDLGKPDRVIEGPAAEVYEWEE